MVLFNKIKFILLIIPLGVYCKRQNAVEQNDMPKYDNSTKPDDESSTLMDLGTLTLNMVQALAKDSDSKEVNLKDLTELVTALSEGVIRVDHPSEMMHQDAVSTAKLAQLEDRLNKQLANMTTEIEKLRKIIDNYNQKAGVTAYLGDSITTSTSGTIVKFDQIVRQYGGYYDQTFGTFTCPVAGDYFASVIVQKTGRNSNSFQCSIKMDSKGTKIATARNDNNQYMSMSTSTVFYCRQFSKIWVEATGSATLTGSFDTPYTSFSIYLLRADNE